MKYTHPQFPRITSNSEVCFGKPRIVGTRMPVSSILSYLSSGKTVNEFISEFTAISKEDVMEAIAFTSLMLEDRFLLLGKASSRTMK
jgi:uncharacterized protein (DUF433 family)